jgi:hypothetical protein
MSQETSQRELLEAAAKRAADKQPDEIRLIVTPDHSWTNPGLVAGYAETWRKLGFTDAGTFTVDRLPVAICFLLKQSDRMYATIYDHPKAGIWINCVVVYEDGTSVTFTSTRDKGLEKRPGHPIVYSPGATADALYAIAARECPHGAQKILSAASLVTEFEKGWADGVRWRKNRGISLTEVLSVQMSRAGQPWRAFRTDRVQFIAEQDGAPERDLKKSFVTLFEHHASIQKAYLVRVTYDEAPETVVALCVLATAPKEMELMDTIRKAFVQLFRRGEHLDMMFVPASDVPRLERVCSPFYTRPGQSSGTAE